MGTGLECGISIKDFIDFKEKDVIESYLAEKNPKVNIMGDQISQRPFSQRQLRVGELVKQNLGELFIRNEAKIPSINSKLITVTEVRMTPDLKTARVYVIPLGGINTKKTVRILTEYSHLVRRALSKRLDIKFLPKLTFVEDNSFEYAEKIERIIKKNKDYDKEKKDIIKSLATHENDVGSTEIQIGLLTDKISKLSEHFKKSKKDKHSTVGLNKSVNKRKNFWLI